jgi:hypothetical protein
MRYTDRRSTNADKLFMSVAAVTIYLGGITVFSVYNSASSHSLSGPTFMQAGKISCQRAEPGAISDIWRSQTELP